MQETPAASPVDVGGRPSISLEQAVTRGPRAGTTANPCGEPLRPSRRPCRRRLRQCPARQTALSSGAPTPKSTEHPASGPRFPLWEGTVIETVLINRLNGSFAGPVECLVTTPVYSHDRQRVVIPAGARVLGAAAPVQTWGDSRLAVSFHRLVMPDGRTYSLDRFKGLDAAGETGLRDRVDRHYAQVFGASLAIGALSGLAQYGTRSGVERHRLRRRVPPGRGREPRDLDRPRPRPLSERLADDHDPRRLSDQGLSHERSRPAGRTPPPRPEVSDDAHQTFVRATAVVLGPSRCCPTPLRAQDYVVYDRVELAEAVIEVFNVVRQYVEMIRQAQRLPVDLANRYRGQSVAWTLQDLASLFARPLLSALNTGDPTGRAYRQIVHPVDVPTDILGRMPAELQRRLATAYATIELADGVAKRGVDQVGATRAIGARPSCRRSAPWRKMRPRRPTPSIRRPRCSTRSIRRPSWACAWPTRRTSSC